MTKDIENIACCRICTIASLDKRPHALLQPIPCPTECFYHVHMDFMEGMKPVTNRGNRYVVVFVDALSHWVKAPALPDIKVETVATVFFEEVICRHGCPIQIITDQVGTYTSAMINRSINY